MQTQREVKRYIAEVYRQHYTNLNKSCKRRCYYEALYEDAVEDCIQEVFLLAQERYETIKSHPNIGGWLMISCHYRLLKKIQAVKSEQKHVLFSLDDGSLEEAIDSASDIDQLLEKDEAIGVIHRILDSLSPAESAVFELYFVQGLSEKEVAQALRTTSERVKSTVHRIRKG